MGVAAAVGWASSALRGVRDVRGPSLAAASPTAATLLLVLLRRRLLLLQLELLEGNELLQHLLLSLQLPTATTSTAAALLLAVALLALLSSRLLLLCRSARAAIRTGHLAGHAGRRAVVLVEQLRRLVELDDLAGLRAPLAGVAVPRRLRDVFLVRQVASLPERRGGVVLERQVERDADRVGWGFGKRDTLGTRNPEAKTPSRSSSSSSGTSPESTC